MDFLSREEIEECIDLGLTMDQAAESLDCGRTTVARYAKHFGLSFSKTKPNPPCLSCGGEKSRGNKSYCSYICQKAYEHRLYIERWLCGEETGSIGSGDASALSRHVRNYLLDKANYQCTQCGWGEINPYTGTIPLEIDHIDGNWKNNRPGNLRVLCPNCHALTPTHKGANAGNGNGSRKYSGNRGEYWKD